MLATSIGPAGAALPADDIGWLGLYSDFSFELIDLDPSDNLSPQVTVSEREFADFFSGELSHLDPTKEIGGFVGPKTEVVLSYKAEITIQALDYFDSFAHLLYEDLGFVDGGQGHVAAVGFTESVAPEEKPFDQYTGKRVTKTLVLDGVFQLRNEAELDVPTFVRFDLSLGATVFDGVRGGPIAAIPEPQTYALMLAGLAGLAWKTRRRRSQQRPALAP